MLSDLDHAMTQAALAAQVTEYADLSRWYAARGNPRLAALAVWAADVRAVHALLWESGLPHADDPEAQLASVGEAVETALLGRGTTSEVSVRFVVEEARRALLAAFDESVHAQLEARLVALDHLDDLPAPASGSANAAVTDRLAGRGAEQLVADLLTASADCRAVARVMAQAGDADEERRQAVSADLAAFEAYLVLTSAASDDATLATTQLRRDLAALRLSGTVDVVPADPSTAHAVRAAILAAVVPAEEPALLSLLDVATPAHPACEVGPVAGGER